MPRVASAVTLGVVLVSNSTLFVRPSYGQQTLWGIDGKDIGTSSNQFGFAVAGAGDIDRDGYLDLLVAKSGNLPTSEAIIVSGESGRMIRSHSAAGGVSVTFANALDSLGDVNGDLIPEYVVSEYQAYDPTTKTTYGKVYCFNGADGSLLYSTSDGEIASNYGYSVAAIGDVDGDGAADFVVGAPQSSKNGCFGGAGYVHSGRDGALIYSLVGEGCYDYFGTAVADAGDVNGDGVPDFVIGAPFYYDPATAVDVGAVYLSSGSTGAMLKKVVGEPRSEFGSAIAAVGDLNHDGFGDIVVGAPEYLWGVGRAYTYLGPDLSLQSTFEGPPAPYYLSHYGFSVAGVGDTDGDGYDDFGIGAPTYSATSGVLEGLVEVHSGADGSILYTAFGDSRRSGEAGWAVAGVGDMSGDGLADVAYGAPIWWPDGYLFVSSKDLPPRVAGVDPPRGSYLGDDGVFVDGHHFKPGSHPAVEFDGVSATRILVYNDDLIHCRTPAGVRGPVSVTVRHSDGEATLRNGFVFTPAIASIHGDLEVGGTVSVDFFCDANDDLVGIWGLPPEVSFSIKPYVGELCICPFQIAFIVPDWPSDVYTASAALPDDPALSGTTFLVQGLIGPSLFQHPKNGAWTNCASFTIK